MRPAKVDIRRVAILVVIVLVVVRFGSKLISGDDHDDGLQFLERLDKEYSNYESDSDEVPSQFDGGNLRDEKNEKEIDYEFAGGNAESDKTKNVLQSNNSEGKYYHYYDGSEDSVNVEFGRWSSYSGKAFESSLKNTRTTLNDISATIVENIVANEANQNHIDTMGNEIEDSVNVEFGRRSSYSGKAFESSLKNTRITLHDVSATIVENIEANEATDNHSGRIANEIDVETDNDDAEVDVYESNADEEIIKENEEDALREGVGGAPMATEKHDVADYLPYPLVTNWKVEQEDDIDYENIVTQENMLEKSEHNFDNENSKNATESNVDLENNVAQENYANYENNINHGINEQSRDEKNGGMVTKAKGELD